MDILDWCGRCGKCMLSKGEIYYYNFDSTCISSTWLHNWKTDVFKNNRKNDAM